MATAAGTLTQLTTTDTGTSSQNRIDEHDADYRRLHAATVARLQASIARYVHELRSAGHDAQRQAAAASRFVARHTDLLRDAYHAGWREGQRDYYGQVSATRDPQTDAPSDEQAGSRLRFYAPSVAKMAAEGLRAAHESLTAKLASPRDSGAVLLYSPDQQRDAHGRWTYEGRMARIKELRGRIAEHQAAIKGLTGQKSKEATATRATARAAIAGHRAEIAEHQAAIKSEKEAPKRKAEEMKAAAEKRLADAKAHLADAERAYATAEKVAAEKQAKNQDLITRLYSERSAASAEADRTRAAAKEALLEERARTKGEAATTATAVKTYQRMLTAEQPMKDARAAHEAASAADRASEAHWRELLHRYASNMARPFSAHDQLLKSHPDYKAAWRQHVSDSAAAFKAQQAKWRKESVYKVAREKLAGKIKDADIHAHPLHASARATLADVNARLGEATGATALRAAGAARAKAQNDANEAEIALKFPAWKYTLHSAPISPARYTDAKTWPEDVLAKAMAAKRPKGVKPQHAGDLALLELQRAQGFDAKPDIISEAELEMHVKAGEVQLWRGDSKISHTDNLMVGDYHAGLGIRGNGTYAQQHEYQGKETAKSYAKDHSDGVIMRMTVKKGARVIDYADLKTKASRAADYWKQQEKLADLKGDQAGVKRAKLLRWLATSDTSRYAVALGYDAVRVMPQGQWIILNRTAIRVSHQITDK